VNGMFTPTRAWAAALAVLVTFALAPVTLFAHGKSAKGGDFNRLVVNEPAPGFTLTDQRGRRATLADFRGRVVVMTFLYTQCTDVCPLLLTVMKGVEDQLADAERAHVRFVGITVDPARDTPERLAIYARERGLDPARWSVLTGNLKEAARVAEDYGIVVRPAPRGDFVHNSVYIVIDRDGMNRVEFHGTGTPVKQITRSVRAILKERPR